jgi:hypothetical protein
MLMSGLRRLRHGIALPYARPLPGPARPATAIALLAVLMLDSTVPAVAVEPTLEWDELYDGGGGYTDEATVALVDPDGNLIVGGECRDAVEGSDMLVRKLNRDTRQETWATWYSAADGNDMALTDMAWDGHGDLIVGGYIRGCVG